MKKWKHLPVYNFWLVSKVKVFYVPPLVPLHANGFFSGGSLTDYGWITGERWLVSGEHNTVQIHDLIVPLWKDFGQIPQQFVINKTTVK